MQGRERVSNGVEMDLATINHGCFGGSQPALTVLVVDQWQNTCVLCGGSLSMPGAVVFQHGLDQVRKQGARHLPCGPGVEIGHQGDGLLSVKRANNLVPACSNQSPELVSRPRHLNLKVIHLRQFLRHSCQ